jgi:hypothetical protein
MKLNKPKAVAGITIPDSKIANQATELLREHGTELLYNHSLRVFVFASLQGQQEKIAYQDEILYICAVFHDLGLTPHYSSQDKRFEVDSANAARDFLKSQGLSGQTLQVAWDAVALHTTPGIAEYKEAEVALLNYGVALDVVGRGMNNCLRRRVRTLFSSSPELILRKRSSPHFTKALPTNQIPLMAISIRIYALV